MEKCDSIDSATALRVPVMEPLVGAVKGARMISREHLTQSLEGVASWMLRSSERTGKRGKSHRLAVYSSDGTPTWFYPNSNTAESISAWLDMAEALGRPELIAYATDYAATLIEDGVHGLYAGPAPEARGLMWYWTDRGSYSSLYSMRVPAQFMRIYALTGEQRYLDTCEVIGEMLLANQEPCGIVPSGWSAARGWAESGDRVGCRFMYVVGTFAKLWEQTGKQKYRDGYERAVQGLLKMQNADGSFFQFYELGTLNPSDANDSIKCMFFAYLFNGIAEAYEVFGDERLIVCASRMADFLVRTFYCRNAVPYCIGKEFLPGDLPEAHMGSFECANGLLWLYNIVRDNRYLDVGSRLWLGAYLNQAERPEEPDIHGAILIGSDPCSKGIASKDLSDRKHLHYSEERAAKCVLWGMVNHVSATVRLLEHHRP